MLQGCSWMHMFQIKNSTDTNWQIEYEMLDERGIFKNQIYILNPKEKKGELIEFDSKIIKFEIGSNQSVRIGIARNAHFNVYKKYSEFDEDSLENFYKCDRHKNF